MIFGDEDSDDADDVDDAVHMLHSIWETGISRNWQAYCPSHETGTVSGLGLCS